MELVRAAGPAIQDLGIHDLEDWGEGFNKLYRAIFDSLFDKNRKMYEHLLPVMEELERESYCGKDKELLARAMARVGGTFAWQKLSADSNP